MGRYYGKCPECNQTISFRDEHTEWANFLEEEYLRGYSDGVVDKERADKAEAKVEAMEGLLAANARVLRKQIAEEASTDSTIPFKCPTEPAGAFKLESGTTLPLETNRSPEPSYGLEELKDPSLHYRTMFGL